MKKILRDILIAVPLALIWFYRKCISPLTPASCRYTPTCSQYGIEAIEKYGALKGLALTAWRILRCKARLSISASPATPFPVWRRR